jgi:hypothetical protein
MVGANVPATIGGELTGERTGAEVIGATLGAELTGERTGAEVIALVGLAVAVGTRVERGAGPVVWADGEELVRGKNRDTASLRKSSTSVDSQKVRRP